MYDTHDHKDSRTEQVKKTNSPSTITRCPQRETPGGVTTHDQRIFHPTQRRRYPRQPRKIHYFIIIHSREPRDRGTKHAFMSWIVLTFVFSVNKAGSQPGSTIVRSTIPGASPLFLSTFFFSLAFFPSIVCSASRPGLIQYKTRLCCFR